MSYNANSNNGPSTDGTSPNKEKMYFKLTQLEADSIRSQITTLTGNFDPKLNLNKDFIDQLLHTLDNRTSDDPSLYRGFLNTPVNDINGDIMKQVIGKNGCYFHLTTTNTGALFIWHDRKSHKIFVWGEKFPTINSLKILSQRINKYAINP